MPDEIRAGFCAIVGLPNVGKSTLLNRVLGRRLVAVSAKPQTTRDRIVGVHTIELPGETPDRAQIAYVDTPGVQDGRGPLRRYMRDAAMAAASDADVVLLLVDATDKRGRTPGEADLAAIGEASRAHPIVVGLNKVDRVAKPELLPLIEAWTQFATGVEVVPLSATQGTNVVEVERAIARRLPTSPPLFPDDMVTDRSPQFIAQEIIREQLYHQLGKELPYACAVKVETWSERPGTSNRREVTIGAVIVVERDSQKPIVVGKGGHRIRELGIAARQALREALPQYTNIHLTLFVKVLSEWSREEAGLRRMGYTPDGGNQ